MFLKRLSTALCAIMCFGGFVMGTSLDSQPNAFSVNESSSLAAPLAVGVLLTPVSPRCNGESNGSINVVIETGTGIAPFTYQLQVGGVLQTPVTGKPLSFSIPDLAAGTYTVKITDSGGATGLSTTTIINNPVLSVSLDQPVTNPACSGGTVDFHFNAEGGNNTAYTYRLYKNASVDESNGTGDFLNKGEGLYNLTVVDGSGCTENYNGTFNINVPDVIDVTFTTQNITCENSFAVLDINNLPELPFTVELTNTTLSKTYTAHDVNWVYSNLDAGSYTLKIYRPNCPSDVQTESFTIAPFNAITLATSPNSPTSLSCGGNNDFTDVDVTINGGQAGRQVKVIFDNNNGIADEQGSIVTYGTVSTFINITVGSYTIRWMDVENPSCFGSFPYIVNGPASPLTYLVSPIADKPACNGVANGTVKVSATGGTPPYKYFVDGTLVGNDPANILLYGGTYAIHVEDGNNCSTLPVNVTIEESPALNMTVLSAQTQQLSCVNGSDGRIFVETTGGRPPYLYTLIKDGVAISTDVPGNATQSFPGLKAGNYEIKVKDAFCDVTLTGTEEIIEVDAIYVDILRTPEVVICRNEETSLFVRAAGGIVGKKFTYSLFKNGVFVESRTEDNYADGQSFGNALLPGNYTVWISYDGACDSISQEVRIYNPQPFNVIFPDTITLDCYGDQASANIFATGEASFSYSFDNITYQSFTNIGSTTITGLIPGDNSIYFKDGKGCIYNSNTLVNIYVNEPEAISIESMTTTPQTNCNGASDAEVILKVTGGSASFEVEVLGSNQRPKTTDTNGLVTFSLPAGNDYNVRVLDINNGCEIQQDAVFSVFEPTKYVISSLDIEKQSLDCFGDSTRVKVNVEGGLGGSSVITVEGGGISRTLSSSAVTYLKGGVYIFRALSEHGCTADTTITINMPAKLVLSSVTSKDVSCFGSNDASITFNTTGGTKPYYWGLAGVGEMDAAHEYSTSPYTISADLAAGEYLLRIADANGCASTTKEVTIEELEPVTFEISKVDSVVCFGEKSGKITLSAAGGSGVYSYAYTYKGTTSAYQNNRELRNLASGDYTVHVKDSKQCAADDQQAVIFEPTKIQILGATIDSAITCYGYNDAIIGVDAVGGEPYNLQYKVTGRTYQTNSQISGLGDGIYEIFVSDTRNKCETKWNDVISIFDPEQLNLLEPEKIDVSCSNLQDGSVSIKAEGGTVPYTYYLYENGSLKGSPQTVGEFVKLGGISTNTSVPNAVSYSIEVRDNNGCPQTRSFSIVNPARLNMRELGHRQVSCNGLKDGWIKVDVSGGTGSYTFKKNFADANFTSDVKTVSTSTFDITNFSGGTYLPLVMDENNCTDTLSAEVEIINPPKLIIAKVEPGKKRCSTSKDDTTLIILDEVNYGTPGNYRYSINDGTQLQSSPLFINALQKTILSYVIDSMGCVARGDTTEIIWPDAFNVNLTKNEIRCWDRQYGTLKAEFSGGTAPYYLSIEDQLFGNPIVLLEDFLSPTTIDTIGDEDNLFLYGKEYEVYLKDNNNCPALNYKNSGTEIPVEIFKWNPVDTLTLVKIDPTRPKCAGEKGSIFYTVKGGQEPYKYWVQDQLMSDKPIPTNQDDDGLVNVPTNINLYAFVTDAYGCDPLVPDNKGYNYLETYIYPKKDTVKVEIDTIRAPYCPSTKDGLVGIEVNGFLKGGFRFYVTKLDTIYGNYDEVFYHEIYIDEATDSTDVIPLDGELVDANEKMYSMRSDTIGYKFTIGLYEITFADNITDCEVSYKFELSPDTLECEDVFPKVFTPNNDGENDLWFVSQYERSKVALKIFTAYGELVYEFTGLVPETGLTWDGIDLKNRPVPAGTYMYIYDPDADMDQKNLEYGTVTILRKR